LRIYNMQQRRKMADPQKRYRKMAPPRDRELIDKIDRALAAERRGRKLWYWPAGPRGRLEASAVIDETGGVVRAVTLAALAAELGRDNPIGDQAMTSLVSEYELSLPERP
jgi:hypothetical protein